MKWTTTDELKSLVKEQGYLHRIILSDEEDCRLAEILDEHPDSTSTPANELRYIEGLLDLPFGYIDEFKVIPSPESRTCACGRTPTALEIVAYAARRNIHSRELMRDTILGLQNIFEPSDSGRQADCIACGRGVVMFSYYKKGYKYA